MMTTQSQAHAFVIRIHKEEFQGPMASAEWRGEVVHVSTHLRASFRGLGEIGDAIEELISRGESA